MLENEHFRVGYNFETDRITLTLMSDNNTSMTMTMSESGARHMIKMLEAAIPDRVINKENA